MTTSKSKGPGKDTWLPASEIAKMLHIPVANIWSAGSTGALERRESFTYKHKNGGPIYLYSVKQVTERYQQDLPDLDAEWLSAKHMGFKLKLSEKHVRNLVKAGRLKRRAIPGAHRPQQLWEYAEIEAPIKLTPEPVHCDDMIHYLLDKEEREEDLAMTLRNANGTDAKTDMAQMQKRIDWIEAGEAAGELTHDEAERRKNVILGNRNFVTELLKLARSASPQPKLTLEEVAKGHNEILEQQKKIYEALNNMNALITMAAEEFQKMIAQINDARAEVKVPEGTDDDEVEKLTYTGKRADYAPPAR